MGCVAPERTKEPSIAIASPKLYVVWIDTNCGDDPADWEMNTSPKPLELAEQEAIECLVHGFLSLILPEGKTPRADGFFSNPSTDPVD